MKRLLILILVAVLLVPVLGCAKEDPLDALWSGPLAPSFGQALAVASELDRLGDQLEPPPMERTTNAIQILAIEVAPYYQYEGISRWTIIPYTSAVYYDGNDNFHVLGRCYLYELVATINVRHINPWSSRWYDRQYLAVLVHEIGHAQGINRGPGPEMEATTQLATLEVLAAMVRDRNAWALPAFVETLRDYAENYAWSMALKQGRMDKFTEYVEARADSEYEIATFYRALDHWSPRMDELQEILTAYGEAPFVLTMESLAADDLTHCGLDSLPNGTGCLTLNDTAYVLRHLRELVAGYDDLLKEYGQGPQD